MSIGWVWCFVCCLALLPACGAKRESRWASQTLRTDSLRTWRADSAFFAQRLYHSAGQQVVWEEVVLAPPDSLRRQHVRRVRRARLTSGSLTRIADTAAYTAFAARQESVRQETAATASASEKRTAPGRSVSATCLLLLAVAAIGAGIARRRA